MFINIGLHPNTDFAGGGALPAPTLATVVNSGFGVALAFTRHAGVALALTGTGFQTGAAVAIIVSGVPQACTSVVVVSSTSITCLTPTISADGLYDMKVTNPDTQSATLSASMRFIQAAAVYQESLGVTLASGKVASILDQSGNGITVSQASAPAQPVVGAAALNGHDVIDYGGGTSFGGGLTNSSNDLFSTGAPFWTFYVGNSGNAIGCVCGYKQGTTDVSPHMAGGSTPIIYIDASGGQLALSGITTEFSSFFYAHWNLPDRVGADAQFFVGGVQKTITVNHALATESGTPGFATGTDPVQGQGLNNKQALWVTFAKTLSTAERQACDNLAHVRYGL
jgi:FlaG/FlaF family flagellin (archaellin)